MTFRESFGKAFGESLGALLCLIGLSGLFIACANLKKIVTKVREFFKERREQKYADATPERKAE